MAGELSAMNFAGAPDATMPSFLTAFEAIAGSASARQHVSRRQGVPLLAHHVHRAVPTFAHAIHYVVSVSAEKQVIRVDTLPNIAPMADEHTFRNLALEQIKGDAMRADVASIDAQPSVSVGRGAAGPYPTTGHGLWHDISPESLLNGGQVGRHGAVELVGAVTHATEGGRSSMMRPSQRPLRVRDTNNFANIQAALLRSEWANKGVTAMPEPLRKPDPQPDMPDGRIDVTEWEVVEITMGDGYVVESYEPMRDTEDKSDQAERRRSGLDKCLEGSRAAFLPSPWPGRWLVQLQERRRSLSSSERVPVKSSCP